ncbi:plasmid stabilization protein [Rhodococcus sp. SRB_17]|uniref:plasmid stabilization protein n=1 Tax=Acidovorax sp. SRB_24 TaxID=1962700 RepID=UPI00145C7FEB|nr:plasmid stabilization protein [Acidovorax sp. SRB_24]NMM77736.1 plasmid stabilization protein [Acidovorax sp. SRB_24]NMM87659.1 plasmid stabilization protein [Rhodococcus sp. SRB_17]
MPKSQWSAKRERQYEHIKGSELKEGKSAPVAEEIAARTVNKVRAQKGEARASSRTSTDDLSPSRRGGLRSHSGARGRTRAQLYEEARQRGIAGRSNMTKSQLEAALKR